MNFLLYMLGRPSRGTATLRPTGREALLRAAATHAAAGRFEAARHCYVTLAGAPGSNALDQLILAQLHLVLGSCDSARDGFAQGMSRLMGGADNSDPAGEGPLEKQLETAHRLLREGRFVRACAVLRRVRAMAELLLAAEAGLVASQGQWWPQAFQALLHVSSLALRTLARAELARQLAGELRQRDLRDDLAAWAIRDLAVDELLAAEQARLATFATRHPHHAQAHHRWGLLAFARNDGAAAQSAFSRVLQVHPHHLASAVRLTSLRRENPSHLPAVLLRSLRVAPETLHLFSRLADAAADPRAFDAAATTLAGSADSLTLRANLTFALSEMALLDPAQDAPLPQTALPG